VSRMWMGVPERFSLAALLPVSDVGVCLNRGFLLSQAGPQTRFSNSSIVRRRLTLTEHGPTWTVVARPDASAFGTWIFSLAWLVSVTCFWYGAHSGLGFVGLWLTAFTPLGFTQAAFQTWGRYTLSSNRDLVTLFTGFGNLGYARQFSLKALLQVRLRTQPTRGGKRKHIVIHADRTLCFGEELSDAQRQYLAAFLILKGRAANRRERHRRKPKELSGRIVAISDNNPCAAPEAVLLGQ
jgi:hypothetical protein